MTKPHISENLAVGRMPYLDSDGKMKLPVLKKKYEELRSAGTPAEREKMLLLWDGILSTACCENDSALAAFYNWCTDRAVAEIHAYQGKTPRLWKFYSSGVIVKSGGIVRAFDLSCGCEMERARRRLRFSPSTIRKLAMLIDEYYATHAHVDHIGVQLVDALVKCGKKIIVNDDTIQKWLLTTALDAEKVKAPGFYCFPSFQRTGNEHLPNCVFVMTLAEGCTILVKGDVFIGSDITALCDWIEKQGLTVDYAIVCSFSVSAPDILSEVRRRFNSTVIPSHEWEFGHRNWGEPGCATQTYESLYHDLRQKKCIGFPLMWGESMELTPRKKSKIR